MQLGGPAVLAELVVVEAAAHTASAVQCQACVRTRRLALTALANLSFNNPQVVTSTAPKLGLHAVRHCVEY